MCDDNSAESVPDEWFDLEISAFLERLNDAAEMGFAPLRLLDEYQSRRKESLKSEDPLCEGSEESPDSYPLVAPRHSIEELDWPPVDWETDQCPIEPSVEAVLQWLNMMAGASPVHGALSLLNALQKRRRAVREDSGSSYVHDAYQLVEFLRRQGVDQNLQEPVGPHTARDAVRELRKVRDAIEEATPEGQNTHSPDFRSVKWNGTYYSFTATQAACIEILWTAWKQGTPEESDAYVLEEAGASAERLSHVFRMGRKAHPAWNTLIVEGDKKGAHRIADPD